MRWNRVFSVKSYIKSSLWVIPVFALLIEVAVTRLSDIIGEWLRQGGYVAVTTKLADLTVVGTRSGLETIVTLNISFIVFTFGSLLVAIQVASGQYTPRIIATTLLRDNTIRYIVGFFVFTLLFSVRTLNRLDTTADHFDMILCAILGLASLAIFLYFIDYAARMLRPVSIVQRVARDGLAVIKAVYPQPTEGETQASARHTLVEPCRTVIHKGNSGIVLAINLNDLIAHAQRSGGVIKFIPMWGISSP